MTADEEALSAPDMAADIAARSGKLLQEMEQLRQHLWALKGEHEHIRGLIALITTIKIEKEAAEMFLAPSEEASQPTGKAARCRGDSRINVSRFRSSNVYALEKQWHIIKRCRHLVSVHQSLTKTNKLEFDCQGGLHVVDAPKTNVGKEPNVLHIHAIVDGGAEWLRIISKDERKLLVEMAEGGWDWDVDEGEQDDQDDAALYEDIETLRGVKDLADAARENWYNYHHPRIRVIFTRIREGQNTEVDRLIQKLRRAGGNDIGISVHCADSDWVTNDGPVDIDTAIPNLLPQADDITGTVILDSSVMIALVSDVSHARVQKLPWHGGDVQGHIDDEADGINFFPCAAYPRLRGRKLVCTRQAMEQFQKIALPMGSPTEVERARVLLEGSPQDFQKHSIHPVPDDFLLPVQVLPGDDEWLCTASLIRDGVLPPVATEVERHLVGAIGNMATHIYGWVSGLTVITSNRILARKIVRVVEASLTGDYDNGPRICALPYNRALATNGPGPKKARKLAQLGLWPLPNQP